MQKKQTNKQDAKFIFDMSEKLYRNIFGGEKTIIVCI